MSDIQEILERKQDLLDLEEILQDSKKTSAKKQLKNVREELSGIEEEIQRREKDFALVEIEQEIISGLNDRINNAVKKSGISFPFYLKALWTPSGGVEISLKPSSINVGRKGEIVFTPTKPLPSEVSVNLFGEPKKYSLKGNVKSGKVFPTWKRARDVLIQTSYPDLWQDWQKTEKYHKSSAYATLGQMTNKAIQMSDFFTLSEKETDKADGEHLTVAKKALEQ